MDLLIPALLCGLCLPLAGHAVVLPWLQSQRSFVSRARHARHNPTPATMAEIAENEAATAEPGASGNTLKLPCKECGRRCVPPVDYAESPPIPFNRAGMVPLGHLGFLITATCTACGSPLVSRRLTEEDADMARQMGVIDGEPLEAEMATWLATL